MKLFYPPIIWLGYFLVTASNTAADDRNIFAEELAYASGIVRWTLVIPEDLSEDEYATFAWVAGQTTADLVDGVNVLRYENGFFDMNPGVELISYLWTDHEGADWLKFRVVFQNPTETGSSRVKRSASLSPPKGFEQPTMYLGSGATMKPWGRGGSGPLLSLQNDSGESIMLLFIVRSDPERPKIKKNLQKIMEQSREKLNN